MASGSTGDAFASSRAESKGWWSEKKCKTVLLCTIDVWNLYLHFRQFEFILRNYSVPMVLVDVISEADYGTLRQQAAFFTLVSIFRISWRIYSHLGLTNDSYGPLIWSYTKVYTQDKNFRAIFYSALDDFTSKLIIVPIILFLSLFQDRLKVSPMGVAMAGIVWLVGSAVTAGLRTAVLVKGTKELGTNCFIYLAICYETAIVIGHVVFIRFLAPWILPKIPEGPSKTTIDGVATRAGYYPRHVVYFESNVEGKPDADPNAYHVGLLGASMIVVTEPLLKIVGPYDIGAVVAHELGHWAYSHSVYSFLAGIANNLCCMSTAIWAYKSSDLYDMFNFDPEDPPHPVIGVLLASKHFFPILIGFVSGFRGVIGYFCEFTADGFAVEMNLGGDLRRSLISLISKIKVFPDVDSWYAAWFRGHPSMVRRIEKLS